MQHALLLRCQFYFEAFETVGDLIGCPASDDRNHRKRSGSHKRQDEVSDVDV